MSKEKNFLVAAHNLFFSFFISFFIFNLNFFMFYLVSSNMGMFSILNLMLCIVIGLTTFPLTLGSSVSVRLSQMSLFFMSFIVFFSNNYFLFYIFFEMSFFPIAILIVSEGFQPERLSAGKYLILYTVITSLFFFVFLLNFLNSFFIMEDTFFCSLVGTFFILLPFFAKSPFYFFHFWLPKAHVEASTLGSVMLASLLLKFGTVGICYFWEFLNFFYFFILCMSTLFSIFQLLVQLDQKKLVAYSSVFHMSLLGASISSNDILSFGCAIEIMMIHAFCSSVMFIWSGSNFYINGSRMIFFVCSSISSINVLILYIFFANGGVPCSYQFVLEFVSLKTLESVCGWLGILNMCLLFISIIYTMNFMSMLYFNKSKKFLDEIFYSFVFLLFSILVLFYLIFCIFLFE